jgi:uncharacterized membrane protein
MKSYPSRSILIIVAFLLAALSSRADATSYAQILKERDDVLSRILADRESHYSSGLVNDEAVSAAQLALYSFRRDTASTLAVKIKNQELIVQLYEKKLTLAKERRSAGLGADIEVLAATDLVLQAKQVLEELQLSAKKG